MLAVGWRLDSFFPVRFYGLDPNGLQTATDAGILAFYVAALAVTVVGEPWAQ